MNRWTSALLTIIILLMFGVLHSSNAEAIDVRSGQSTIPLTPRTIVFDAAGRLSPSDAAKQLANPGAEVETGTYSHGYLSGALWARIVLDVSEDAAGRWYLSLELPNFDQLDVYRIPGSVAEITSPVRLFQLGDRVVAQTDIRMRFHLAPIDLSPGRTVLLVRGETASTMTLDLNLRRLDGALVTQEQAFFGLQMFYLGIGCVLFLGALALFAYTRQLIYAVYLVNLIAHTGIWLIVNGTGPGVLWPELARRFPFEVHALLGLSISGTMAFSAMFLATARVPRVVRISLWGMSIIGLLLCVACLVVPHSYAVWTNALVSQVALPVSAALVIPTAVALFYGEPAARPLLLTWIGLIAAIALGVLRNQGFVPSNTLTLTGPQLGSVFEMIVFAYMLVDRLGRLQRDKERLQSDALIAAREHETLLERRVAERTGELDAANSRLRTIINAAPFPLILVREADEHVLFVNRQATDLLGPTATLPNRPLDAGLFVDPSVRAGLLEALRRTGYVDGWEAELRAVDEHTFWTLVSLVRIQYDGEPVRVLAINDISPLKALEQDLRRTAEIEAAAARREREARRLQQQFVAMVSHEFRTPLSVIEWTAENAALQEPTIRPRADKIRASVKHLLRMIDSCLIDERVEGGRIHLQRQEIDLRDLVDDLAESLQSAARDHQLETVMPDGPLAASVDPRLIEIALSNLIENALKYAPAGTAVRIGGVEAEGFVRIWVDDAGPGLPQEERERVFERYYRVGNASGIGGSGLGLHVVREILKAHGGTAGCETSPMGGARFILQLPSAPHRSEGDSA